MSLHQKLGTLLKNAYLHFEQGRLHQSQRLLDSILTTNPNLGIALVLRARIRCAVGDYQGASNSVNRALIIEPDNADWMCDLAVISVKSDHWEVAVDWYKRVLAVKPSDSVITAQLVIAMTMCGEHSSATMILEDFGPTKTWSASMWRAQGMLSRATGDSISALSAFEKTAALSPEDAETLLDSAYLYYQLNRSDKFWHRYTYRWKSVQADQIPNTNRPAYNEHNPSGRVLAWAEQGVGDEIMYGALLNDFKKKVGQLTVEMDRRLIPIFRRSMDTDIIFRERGLPLADDDFDCHLAIGNLGLFVPPRYGTCKSHDRGYLKADPQLVVETRNRLKLNPGERLVGISWLSANPRTGRYRSLPLRELVTRNYRPGTRFISLQYGLVNVEFEELERELGITVLECPGLDLTNDLDGVAALIETCEEVISIGNTVAHLAGALGKKTTVLVDQYSPWRWRLAGESIPWYPSVILKKL